MSNLSNTVKVQSQQGGTLSASKNIISFVIPDDGNVVDLSQSHINVNMSVEGDLFTNMFVRFEGQNNETFTLMNPSALVKNASLTSDKKGMIESLKLVSQYRDIVSQYTDDLDTKQNQSHLGLMATKDKNQANFSPFRVLSVDKVGESRSHDVRIPLSDIFGIAKSNAYATDVYGRTMIHTELNIDKLSAAWSLGATDPIWTVDTNKYSKCDAQAVAGGGTPLPVSVITTFYDYNESTWKEDAPFWVNMPVTVSGTNGATAFTVDKTITSLTFNTANKDVYITLDSAIVTIAAGTQSTFNIKGRDQTNPVLSVNSAELVVKYVNEPNPPQSHEFITVLTEQDNANGVLSHNKNYIIEPECVNLLIGLKGGNENHNTVSALNFADYRISVDNENLTNKNIKNASPEQYDRISRYMMNHGKPVGNLHQRKIKPTISKTGDIDLEQPVLCNSIIEVMPLTPSNKIVGVEINSAIAISNLVLFKEVIKSV